MDFKEFKDLEGLTLISVEGMEKDSEQVVFTEASGRKFYLMHRQDCCETVYLEDVCGDVEDLLGVPILGAKEVTNIDLGPMRSYTDSYTWTFYRIYTQKGAVTLRWYGESNGYYSERVSFYEDTEEYDTCR